MQKIKLHIALLSVISLVLPACTANIRDFDAPVTPSAHFSDKGIAPLADKWWLAFHDTFLNSLIEQALGQNFNLLSSYDRLAQARAIAKKAGAELLPQLNTSFAVNRSVSGIATSQRTTVDQFSAGFVSSYELDLWGRIRSGMNAALLDQQAAQEDINIAAISLSAEIARTWYKLVDQRKQAELLDTQIKINQDNVTLLVTRFNLGQARAADVLQQKQVLQSTLGNKESVIANIKSLEYQLNTLLGKPLNSLIWPKNIQFPKLPAEPQTGLASDLIKRRPDIRKAYYKIQAADQRIAAAIADRFPKISLSASINTNSPDIQNLFNNWLATLAGNLVLPVIDGHRRIAEVERNKAVFSETVNQYAATILKSLEEVETALIQEKQQARLLKSLDRQIILATQAHDQIRLRYRYGAIDFLRVLSSHLDLQALQRTRIRAERELIGFRIDLYKALAGGWPISTPSPQTPENLIHEKS